VQSPPDERSGLTLSRLIQTLGAPTLDYVGTQGPTDRLVTGAHIYDPSDPGNIGPGDLVLAVNIDPASPAAAALVGEAGGRGAVAVALKVQDGTGLQDLLPLAGSSGIALVRVDQHVSWDQLYALIRHATATTSAPDDEDSPPLGDLFSLANALAASIGGAVSIEDPRSSLLAYSTLDQPIDAARRETILGRRTPGIWMTRLQEEDIPRQLAAAPMKAVFIHDPRAEADDRLAVSVTAGPERLGVIWVVQGERPFDEEAKSLLEEVAPLAALHLLRHRAAEDMNRTERGRLLQALLDGARSAAEVGPSLGIDAGSRCAVVCFHLAGDDEVDLALKRSRALDLIVLACEAFRRQVACTGIGRNVYALFPGLSTSSASQLETFARDISVRASEALGARVVAGIGSTVAGLAAAPTTRREADRAARVLARPLEARTVASIDLVQVPSILLEFGDVLASRPDLKLPALEVLARHDTEHSKSYVETLRALADAFWDVPVAAHALGLHPNSLRYRMKRIEEISGLILDDPRHCLVVSLQFIAPEQG
jgi:sugar diacid utilization regulator